MTEDTLGDRMKLLEQQEAGRKFLPLLPIMARIDGKTFHNWTKDLDRPYDGRFTNMMIETTKFLVEETGAKIGYTQSDEISLIYYSDTYESQIFFDGKIHKMNSVLASFATGFFNSIVQKYFEEKRPLAYFDCRVWQVPTKMEAVNTILWRELDASKNSISMAARHYFSHNQLMNKTGSEMQEMMFKEHGVNWNDYPTFFKRGTYIQRRKVLRKFTEEELARIHEKFRPGKDEVKERTDIIKLELPQLTKISNRVEVIFDGADPEEMK